ncbi:putative membrane protein [Allocatelliglobosispora scoriae]|uniref:Putative membrane protein n=1 Tax=Allocatelliglobosispora scoriae TaxID=643052 RepID=A0A841BRC8_9ACTN|nr:DUF1345 domain-containing protein [Allocatelliglobosispora scoriae]MBB5869749.1 putative membrane protein [Allocatelliglobosispora scoriae]
MSQTIATVRRQVGALIFRATEVVLAVGGFAFTVFGGDTSESQVLFLLLWSTVAITYLIIGGFRIRRQRLSDPNVPEPAPPQWSAVLLGRRFSFFFTAAASLTGLGAALDVLGDSDKDEYTSLITGLGVVVMVAAWMLLHLGYARFYAQWTEWRFPACPHPNVVDFLYFSFTLGVSFAASDVEVQSRALRWHVMVHSVISFFYNAIVLAIAVGIVTGK